MKIDFDKILTGLEPIKGKVFILPLEREYLYKLSKRSGIEFPEIYLGFREKIGFTQDLLPDLLQTEDSLIDDLDYTEAWCKDFFPIGTFSTEETDYTWLIEKNSENGQLYQVDNEEEENAKPQKLEMTLTSLIEKEIKLLKRDYKKKLSNTDKVRLFEFKIKTKNFDRIIAIINETIETKWIDARWRDKYTPNDLGIEVAFLEIGEFQVIAQRERDLIDGNISYFFELEEPLEKIDKKSIAEQIKELFDSKQIEYKFTDYGIIENEDYE